MGSTSYAAPILSWAAALGAGQTATIAYSLTVDDPPTGDLSIDNAVIGLVVGNCVIDDGLGPNAQQVATQISGLGSECITETEVVPPTPSTTTTTVPPTTRPTPSIPATGGDPAPTGQIAVLLLFAGGVLLLVARARLRRS